MSALAGAVLGLHRFGMLRYRETERFLDGLFGAALVCWFLVIQPAKDWGNLMFTPRIWFVVAIIILLPLLSRDSGTVCDRACQLKIREHVCVQAANDFCPNSLASIALPLLAWLCASLIDAAVVSLITE